MLSEALYDYDCGEENTCDETSGTFKIDSDRLADWALEKIKVERDEMDRLVELCKQKIEVYTEKIDQVKKSYENNTSFLTSCLVSYFHTVPHKVTKTQEIYKLASGTLRLKIKPPEFVRDEGTLIKWLEEQAPDYVKVKKEPVWGEFKKQLVIASNGQVITKDGELVDGITVVERPPEFVVEV